MKIELNLTSAFTLRKRIKELGRVNEQILAYSKYVVEPEQVDEELENFQFVSIISVTFIKKERNKKFSGNSKTVLLKKVFLNLFK